MHKSNFLNLLTCIRSDIWYIVLKILFFKYKWVVWFKKPHLQKLRKTFWKWSSYFMYRRRRSRNESTFCEFLLVCNFPSVVAKQSRSSACIKATNCIAFPWYHSAATKTRPYYYLFFCEFYVCWWYIYGLSEDCVL